MFLKKLIEGAKALLRPVKQEQPLVAHTLSRRIPKHEFTILQVTEPGVFKASMGGRIQLLNMSDWKLFARDLQAYCLTERVMWRALQDGKVRIHCVGFMENLPRGIKYTWQFNKL